MAWNSRPVLDRRPPRPLLLGAAALLVALQTALRGWALYPSWFWADDYRLLLQARAEPTPGWDYLFRPFDSHVMPAGRLLAWLVAESGTTNWALAATVTLVVQVLASVACVWMLLVLFGDRWAVLGLLAVYLTSAVTVPAFIWWAASLNQLPPQVTFFVAVACWVHYLRGRRWRWALAATLAVAVGLLFDVRAVLVVPLLAILTVVHFGQGRPRRRVVEVLRRYWPGLLLGGGLAAAYAVTYAVAVPAPFEASATPDPDPLGLADRMLATTAASGVVGGPWRWLLSNPPIVLADPPPWTVHLTWVVIASAIAVGVLRRERTAGGWVLLATQGVALYALLAATRGRLFGPVAGLEYRYLTELGVVLPLALGLVFLEVSGAPGSSRARREPLLTRGVPTWATVALVLVVSLGGVVSTVRYVGYWHHQNANRDWVKNLQSSLASADGTVDLPPQTVPDRVLPAYTEPANRTQTLVPFLAGNARFPRSTDDLRVIDPGGTVKRATIGDGPGSVPGTVPGCGTRISAPGGRIALDGDAFFFTWWIQIGYLSSARSPVSITAGDETVRTEVRTGLHNLFVRVRAGFDEIIVDGLAPGTTVCVDAVDVGQPVVREDQ